MKSAVLVFGLLVSFSSAVFAQQCLGTCQASGYALQSQARACRLANASANSIKQQVCESLPNCYFAEPRSSVICMASGYALPAQARACRYANAQSGQMRIDVCNNLPGCFVVAACE